VKSTRTFYNYEESKNFTMSKGKTVSDFWVVKALIFGFGAFSLQKSLVIEISGYPHLQVFQGIMWSESFDSERSNISCDRKYWTFHS